MSTAPHLRRIAGLTLGLSAVVAVAMVSAGHLVGTADAPAQPVARTVSSQTDPTIPRDRLDTMTPKEIAAEELKDRGDIAPENLLPTTYRAPVYGFGLSSFNVLGSQHTAPGGDAQQYAPGRIRADWSADLLDSYSASVVGLQELQLDQLQAFNKALDQRFDFWPGTALGWAGVPQSLMWDKSQWRATYTDSITIPFVGQSRPQPIVRLQNISTGREIYVINIHNAPQDRQAERDKAIKIEIAAVNLLRQQDGLPVFLIGDFNEKATAFCKVTGQTDLVAAQGGSNDGTTCSPPDVMRVDWIFGSPDAQFSGFRFDTRPPVRRITDHAVLKTGVSVP